MVNNMYCTSVLNHWKLTECTSVIGLFWTGYYWNTFMLRSNFITYFRLTFIQKILKCDSLSLARNLLHQSVGLHLRTFLSGPIPSMPRRYILSRKVTLGPPLNSPSHRMKNIDCKHRALLTSLSGARQEHRSVSVATVWVAWVHYFMACV